MSDKEFEAWKTKNYYYIQRDTRSQSHFSFENALKWLKIAWQEATPRATAAERKRSVDILETRYHELSQLKTDDNSDACWEDYNYSQKEIARLLKSLQLEGK